jgi:hypothetical protein
MLYIALRRRAKKGDSKEFLDFGDSKQQEFPVDNPN